jgi:hypothetical protein
MRVNTCKPGSNKMLTPFEPLAEEVSVSAADKLFLTAGNKQPDRNGVNVDLK